MVGAVFFGEEARSELMPRRNSQTIRPGRPGFSERILECQRRCDTRLLFPPGTPIGLYGRSATYRAIESLKEKSNDERRKVASSRDFAYAAQAVDAGRTHRQWSESGRSGRSD